MFARVVLVVSLVFGISLLFSLNHQTEAADKAKPQGLGWQTVRVNEPKFASDVAELVESLLEAGIEDEEVVCLTEEQVEKLRKELCALKIIDCRPPAPQGGCRTCRRAGEHQELEAYLDCMMERMNCLISRN